MHYVIGDVHGCYNELTTLITKINIMDSDAHIIFTGDFIDRGPDVDKVLEWCFDNITFDGKYQTVRGNHEQMAYDWCTEWFKWKNYMNGSGGTRYAMPQTAYGFERCLESMGKLNDGYIRKYMAFVMDMPYSRTVDIVSVWGKPVTYRIVHADYNYDKAADDDIQHYANLWGRQHTGCPDGTEIMLHGHTPTIADTYIEKAEYAAPGLIGYNHMAVNVDGGCVYHKDYPEYPAMLCAIRLEDMMEIYPYQCSERFLQSADSDEQEEQALADYYEYKCWYMNRENVARERLLDMLM